MWDYISRIINLKARFIVSSSIDPGRGIHQ